MSSNSKLQNAVRLGLGMGAGALAVGFAPGALAQGADQEVAIEEIILGRGLAGINHNQNWNSFLLYQLQRMFYEDDLMGGGAIFNSITKDYI